MHGLEGGVGTSSSEVFHAYPTETLRDSVHESPVRPLPDAQTEKKTQGWRPWKFPWERLSARPKL
jgi:hypothetical protein